MKLKRFGIGNLAFDLASLQVQRTPLQPDSLPSSYSLGLREIVCAMLKAEASLRPTAQRCTDMLNSLAKARMGHGGHDAVR
jgi:hypothetical protein